MRARKSNAGWRAGTAAPEPWQHIATGKHAADRAAQNPGGQPNRCCTWVGSFWMKPTVSVNSTALPPASSTRLRRVGAAKAQAFRQVQAWRVLAWQEAAPELATLLPAPRWRPEPHHISCSGAQRGETACLVLSHHPFRLRLATLPRHDYQWSPRGGVQRGKQLVLGQHPRVGQRVEQRGLACRVPQLCPCVNSHVHTSIEACASRQAAGGAHVQAALCPGCDDMQPAANQTCSTLNMAPWHPPALV